MSLFTPSEDEVLRNNMGHLLRFLGAHDNQWSGTVSDLSEQVARSLSDDDLRHWPASTFELTDLLRHSRPTLRKRGMLVSTGKRGGAIERDSRLRFSYRPSGYLTQQERQTPRYLR